MTSHELNQLERLNEYLLVMVIPNVRKKIREASLLQDGSEQRKQKIAELKEEVGKAISNLQTIKSGLEKE